MNSVGIRQTRRDDGQRRQYLHVFGKSLGGDGGRLYECHLAQHIPSTEGVCPQSVQKE